MTLLATLLLACSSGHRPDGGDAASGFASPAEAEDLDAAADVLHVALVADERTETAAAKSGDHGDTTASGETVVTGYAYNGQVPGPTLRAKVGDTIVVDLTNELDATTTLHWHGMAVPYAMDGVVWRDDPVEPGETRRYEFVADRAGTFWYHPHVNVVDQVEGGLYGVVVVEDPAEPVADRELVIVWQATAGGTGSHDDGMDGDIHDTGAATAAAKSGGDDHDHSAHGVSDPADLLWTANGSASPTVELPAGERVRVRMLNAAKAGYLDLTWPGMRRIGGDQGLLGALDEPERFLMAPGDRAEFEWVVGDDGFSVETGLWTANGGQAAGAAPTILSIAPTGGGASGVPLEWPFDGAAPTEDAGNTDLAYVFTGGADGTWAINGEVYPDVTVETLPLGTEAVLDVRNLSPSEHPFHLHGHRFEVLSVDGVAPAVRTWEDTVNVGVLSRVRLRLVADNAGDWMVHCHLLDHEEGGMMTILRIE